MPLDTFGGGYPLIKIPLYKSFTIQDQKLFLLRENSHTSRAKDKVEQILGTNKLDLLFIDGDHTYKGVKEDFQMYSPLVRNGGIIAIHDIALHLDEPECEVYRFWNEIKTEYRYKECIENHNQGWCGLGILLNNEGN